MSALLPDAEARNQIDHGLTGSLFVEAGAGSGKTYHLVNRVVGLISSGVNVRALAVITFTEKAAAELRARIREELLEKAAATSEHRRFQEAVEHLDAAAIVTLHSFAQRLLLLHPVEAGLPPRFEVRDGLGTSIDASDRWAERWRGLLDDARMSDTLRFAAAIGIKPQAIRDISTAIDDDWDLATDPVLIPWSLEPIPVKADDVRAIRDATQKVLGLQHLCKAPDDDASIRWFEGTLQPFLNQLPDQDAPLTQLVRYLYHGPQLSPKSGCGSKKNWNQLETLHAARNELQAVIERVKNSALDTVFHNLLVAGKEQALRAADQRLRSGTLSFHDLLVRAVLLLEDPSTGKVLRQSLRDRFRYLLIDEFQDTDPLQLRLALLLAIDPGRDDEQRPTTAELVQASHGTDGRLFFVGDPKQSIYRFRRADVALYQQVSEHFRNSDDPASNDQRHHVELTTCFRSSPPLIDFINSTFEKILLDGFSPLTPDPRRTPAASGPTVAVLGARALDKCEQTESIVAREAHAIAWTLQLATGHVPGQPAWTVSDKADEREAQYGNAAILLPTRTALPALTAALDDADVPYRLESASLVYATEEVRGILATLRAVADPSDELALVSALRSPVFGCGDDDLLAHRAAGDRFSLSPQPGTNGPPAESIHYLRELRRSATWRAPSELLRQLIDDRLLMEAALDRPRARDMWRRLRFVVDQARRWERQAGPSLRSYLEWIRAQADPSLRVREAILPEEDDDAVRIMTIHAAKGLEFPITIVAATRNAPSRQSTLQRREGYPVGLRINADLQTSEYDNLHETQELENELKRLAYVACTRARDHLVLSLFRHQVGKPSKLTIAQHIVKALTGEPTTIDLPTDELGLYDLLSFPDEPPPSGESSAMQPAGPPPWLDDWERTTEKALKDARPIPVRAVSSKRETEAGDDDAPAPRWRGGAYGMEVGRAVHQALQVIELTDGTPDIDGAVHWAVQQEGLPGQAAEVRQLVEQALATSLMLRARAALRRWRETYVAGDLEGQRVEGFIDLLFEEEDHLVVVDYKTASSDEDLRERSVEYFAQLEGYRRLLEPHAGGKPISCHLLYLTPNGAKVHEVTSAAAGGPS